MYIHGDDCLHVRAGGDLHDITFNQKLFVEN